MTLSSRDGSLKHKAVPKKKLNDSQKYVGANRKSLNLAKPWCNFTSSANVTNSQRISLSRSMIRVLYLSSLFGSYDTLSCLQHQDFLSISLTYYTTKNNLYICAAQNSLAIHQNVTPRLGRFQQSLLRQILSYSVGNTISCGLNGDHWVDANSGGQNTSIAHK